MIQNCGLDEISSSDIHFHDVIKSLGNVLLQCSDGLILFSGHTFQSNQRARLDPLAGLGWLNP